MLWHLFHCPQVPSTGSSSLSPTGTHSERMHHSPSPHGVPSAHGMCWVLHLINKCGIGNIAKKIYYICRIYSKNLCFFKDNRYGFSGILLLCFAVLRPCINKSALCASIPAAVLLSLSGGAPEALAGWHVRADGGALQSTHQFQFRHFLCNWVLGVNLRRPEAKS
jgi:hypothetical protein